MSIKKYGSGNWGYYFGHEGKRYRKQGFATKREAVEAETKAKNDLIDGFQLVKFFLSIPSYIASSIELLIFPFNFLTDSSVCVLANSFINFWYINLVMSFKGL